jgi:hypothetical protein
MQYLLLGIRWGQLECNESVETLAQWDGFLQVTKGLVIPIQPAAWETGGEYRQGCDDILYEQRNHLTLEWRSSTVPCWDGLIVLIAVPERAEPAPMVTIHTEKWESINDFEDLVDIHRIIPVDRLGNEVEILTKLIRMPEPADEPKPAYDKNYPDEDGKPVTDEKPEVRGEEPEEGRFELKIDERHLMEIKEMITHIYRERLHPFVTEAGEKGYYAFKELPSGHYRMWARSPEHIEYFNEFTIKDGQHLYIDVYLRREMPPGHREREWDERPCEFVFLEGQVVHIRSGEPIPNARITFYRLEITEEQERPMHDGEHRGPLVVETNERGHFEAKVPCGMYKLTVEARGYEMHVMRLDLTSEMPEFVKIEMKPGTADGSLSSGENSDKRPQREGGERKTVDASGLGVEVVSEGALSNSMLVVLIAALICGIVIPLVLLVRSHKAKAKKEPQPKPQRKLKTLKGQPRTKPVKPRPELNKNKEGRAKPSFSKPFRDF